MPCNCMRIESGICGYCRTSLMLSGELTPDADRVNRRIEEPPTLREMEVAELRQQDAAARRAEMDRQRELRETGYDLAHDRE